jgi:hypothetical protein
VSEKRSATHVLLLLLLARLVMTRCARAAVCGIEHLSRAYLFAARVQIRFLRSALRDCSRSSSRVVFLLSRTVLPTTIFITNCFDQSSPTLSSIMLLLRLHLQIRACSGIAQLPKILKSGSANPDPASWLEQETFGSALQLLDFRIG